MTEESTISQGADDAFERRVADIVAKLVERNSLSNREAKAVQTEADKLLEAVQNVIDARVKHHIDQVKLGLKVAGVCLAIFGAVLIPSETRKAVGRLLVPQERIQSESMAALSEAKVSDLGNLKEYIDKRSVEGVPEAFRSVAHTNGAQMLAESVSEKVIEKRLASFYSEVESGRLAGASPSVVIEYGSKPRLFDAVEIGEQFLSRPTLCGELLPSGEPVAVIATPFGSGMATNYFWYGCPGTYPVTWVRLTNRNGESEPIRIISVERGAAKSDKGRPEVRLNYAAVLAARELGLQSGSRTEVNVRVVRACRVVKKPDEQSDCRPKI